MIKQLIYISISSLLLLVGTSCENKTTRQTQKEEKAAELNPLQIKPLSKSKEFPEAKLSLIEPGNLNDLSPGKTTFKFKVEHYELGAKTDDQKRKGLASSEKGQHIHVILNNKPYMAKYKDEFKITLEEKSYNLIAFLSRSYHESIKNPEAFVNKQFTVGSSKDNIMDTTQLFYSRPKGNYKGEGAKKILLDFYLPYIKLSEYGYNVRVSIDGKEQATLSEWKSYYIEGLKDGKHDITIELLDAKGNVVRESVNTTTRTITVEH